LILILLRDGVSARVYEPPKAVKGILNLVLSNLECPTWCRSMYSIHLNWHTTSLCV